MCNADHFFPVYHVPFVMATGQNLLKGLLFLILSVLYDIETQGSIMLYVNERQTLACMHINLIHHGNV